MGRIIVRSVHFTGTNDLDRRFVIQHNSCLHRRSLRTKQNIVGNIERILHISRRVIRRNIEKLEVVVIKLHFRSFFYFKPHSGKSVYHQISRNGQRMQPADSIVFFQVKRNIDLLFGDLFGFGFGGKFAFRFADLSFDLLAQFIDLFAKRRFFLR